MDLIKEFVSNMESKQRSQKIRIATELKFAALQYFNDDFEMYLSFIKSCDITNIELKNNKLDITMVRVGIFIGRKGETINGIMKNLDENYKINLIEDKNQSLIKSALFTDYSNYDF